MISVRIPIRLVTILAVGVCTNIADSGDAFATCGDYLLHRHADAQSGQATVVVEAEAPLTGHVDQRQPCRGPGCRNGGPVEQPRTPPATVITVAESAIADMLESPTRPVCAWPVVADDSMPLDGFALPPDRPPCAG